MGTKIKIFHSGDYKSHEGLENRVNSFCEEVTVEHVHTATRGGITLASGTQTAQLTYDIIVVYGDNNKQSSGDYTNDLIREYAAMKDFQENKEKREAAFSRYVAIIEKVIPQAESPLTYTSIAAALGTTPVALKTRDTRMTPLLEREVNSVKQATENLGLRLTR